jgi:hypothetical protein
MAFPMRILFSEQEQKWRICVMNSMIKIIEKQDAPEILGTIRPL